MLRYKKALKNKVRKKTSNRIAYYSRVEKGLRPKEVLTVSQYADKYRILPKGSSAEYGLWRTSRFPFLEEIMDHMSVQSDTQTVVVQKASQVGVTEAAINVMCYRIEHEPTSILYIQKTLTAIDRFIRQRWDKSIRAMKSLKRLLNRKKKGGGNTKGLKTFPGGIIVFGGANSAASLRSMPMEVLILDEEDSYEGDIQEEGSPVDLSIVRTRNYPRRKIFRLSSPGLTETSTIEPAFKAGDQRYYKIPCPFCKNMDHIRFENLKYVNNDPKTVALQCESCGALIEEHYKTWMFAKENGAHWQVTNPEGDYPSYHLPAFYSPLGFYSWREIITDWIKAVQSMDHIKLKTFINTVLGETYSAAGEVLQAEWIQKRKETYTAEVPEGGRILSMGVDVQENRIEAEILAYGEKEEHWSIDYVVFTGDTELDQIWDELEMFIKTYRVRHASGGTMGLSVVGVDSGHRAKRVYAFCKKMEAFRVFPVKGRDGWGKGYLERPKKRNLEGVFLYILYVDELKSKVYSQLKIKEAGPSYCHFPNKEVYNEKYFNMICSEQLKTVVRNGKKRLGWELPVGRRNEALDARVYAIGALNILGPTLSLVEQGKFTTVTTSTPVIPVRKKKVGRVISRGIS